MRTKILIIVVLVLSGCTVLQTYKGDPNQKEDVISSTNPIKNSGVRYYRQDITQANAPDTTYGSEVAVLVDSAQMAVWDRENEVFVPVGGMTTSKSDPSGAPATGQPWAHINTTTGIIRRWDGSAWVTAGRTNLVDLDDTPSAIAQDSVLIGSGDSLIFAPRLPEQQNTYYVDPSGNNATAQKGRIDLPWSNLQGSRSVGADNAQRLVLVNQGYYLDAGPWPAAVADSVIYNRSDTSHFELRGQAIIDITAEAGETFYGFSDVETVFGDNRAKKISVNGPNATLRVDAASDGGIKVPISAYHFDSEIDVKLKNLIGVNGRVWGMQVGAKKVNIDIEEFNSDNAFAVSVYQAYDDTGVKAGKLTRNINVHFDKIIGGNDTDLGGAIRISSTSVDSGSIINLSVDKLNLHESVIPFNSDMNELSEHTTVNVHIGEYARYNAGAVAVSGYTVGGAAQGEAFELQDIPRDSSVFKFSSNIWYQQVGPITASFVEGGVQRTFDNTTIIFDMGEVSVDEGTAFMIDRFNLINGSKIIIKCNDCRSATNSIVSVFNNTIDATSGIYIEGSFKVDAASPVIQTNSSRVFLNGIFENDGTVPAIEANAAATVYVSGAFDANTIMLDPDVTFVRLDEYGASGADGNGIYTGSGIVPSSVVATLTDNISFSDGVDPLLTIDEASNIIEIGGNNNTSNKYWRHVSNNAANGMTHTYSFLGGIGVETLSNTSVANRSWPILELYRRGDDGSGLFPNTVVTAQPDNSVTGQINFRKGNSGGGSSGLFSVRAFYGTSLTSGSVFQINDDHDATFNTLLELDRGTGTLSLPLGNLDFGNTAAKINATSQLEILGASGGTAQSRIVVNSSTAAGGTIIEDRDPGTPANAANLTLNWDGTSTLTTNNQQFTVGTGTARQEYTGLSFDYNPSDDANQWTIQDQGFTEWLRFKRDFGAGGGYQLMYESGSFSNRTIFDATSNQIRYGNGFAEMYIEADLEHTGGQADEKVLVIDTLNNRIRTRPANMTGWAQYSSTTINRTTPQTITNGVGDTLNLSLVPTDSIVFEMPYGFESLFNSADSTIIAMNSGDAFQIRFDLDVRSSTTDNYGVFLLDIGGSQGVIVERTISFPRGAGVWTRQSISFNYYTLGTFVANGGQIRLVAPDDNWDVANPTVVITKVHHGGQ